MPTPLPIVHMSATLNGVAKTYFYRNYGDMKLKVFPKCSRGRLIGAVVTGFLSVLLVSPQPAARTIQNIGTSFPLTLTKRSCNLTNIHTLYLYIHLYKQQQQTFDQQKN